MNRLASAIAGITSGSSLVALLPLMMMACTSTIAGPWSAWNYRDPATVEEWQKFYSLAMEEMNYGCQCLSTHTFEGTRCVAVRQAAPGSPEDACKKRWAQRIRSAFLDTHPDLDSQTRQAVANGQVQPALDAATVVEQARQMRQQAEEAERGRAEKERADQKAREQVPPSPAVDKRSYRSVIGTPPDYTALACDDPIVLQNALEYRRVGDYAHLNQFLGYGGGRTRRCKMIQGGSVVFATSIGQGGYRQIRTKDVIGVGLGSGFPMVIQLWMRERDLALCAEDDNPSECHPAKGREADVSAKDGTGRTSLIWASEKGDQKAVRALLDAKADVNAKAGNGMTALMLASGYGHQEVVRALLDAKADVNAKAGNGGTALIYAAEQGHTEVVRALLDAKADVNAKASTGGTALMYAAQNGHEEVVQLLKNAGANESDQEKGIGSQPVGPYPTLTPIPTRHDPLRHGDPWRTPREGAGGTIKGAEYLLYYNQLLSRIKQSWAWAGTDRALEAVVHFNITESGEVVNIRVTQASGDASYDAAVERAVRAVNPLPPPPDTYRKEFSDVELTFSPEQMQ